ncbi:MAG: YkgJ family cysteine cluster protein [Desulfobacteraceae bacterium]|nr:YkgJ family cysteine cluster protein [Desulfobacteraceae bacterium]
MIGASLSLSMAQAMKAICMDFKAYDPQPMLFCEVLRTMPGDMVTYKRGPGQNGLWVSNAQQPRLRWLEGPQLVEFMCAAVCQRSWEPDQLAALCRLVFQTHCRAEICTENGEAAIWIQTDLTGFHCQQCGRCCTHLDYHDEITSQDVQRISDMGREDVLKWIGTAKGASGENVYRIWVIPGTNRFAHPCPFLGNGSSSDKKICTIHDIKPQICRQYPLSRKHALMTGCPGFDK